MFNVSGVLGAYSAERVPRRRLAQLWRLSGSRYRVAVTEYEQPRRPGAIRWLLTSVMMTWMSRVRHRGVLPERHINTKLFTTMWSQYHRARQKSNTLRKIRYLWNCGKFFRHIDSDYKGGFRPHILQISLQYNIWLHSKH